MFKHTTCWKGYKYMDRVQINSPRKLRDYDRIEFFTDIGKTGGI